MRTLKKAIVVFSLFICLLISLLLINMICDEKDACLDMNICKEGLKVNTEYGLITINEENCQKYNWHWDSKNKRCNLRK